MAAKKKIINIRVYFDGDQDAKEVFAEVIAQKIRDTKTKDTVPRNSIVREFVGGSCYEY